MLSAAWLTGTFGDDFARWLAEDAADDLDMAYRQARDLYDPDKGHDAQLYSFAAFKGVNHQLARRFGAHRVRRPSGSFCICVGEDLRVWPWKLGSSAKSSVRLNPSRSKVRARVLEANTNIRLPFNPNSPSSGPSEFVLGHFGNPRRGLVRLGIGAPVQNHSGWSTDHPWTDLYVPTIRPRQDDVDRNVSKFTRFDQRESPEPDVEWLEDDNEIISEFPPS